MRLSLRAGLMLAISVCLSGCYFDQPLTKTPSKNLNSWLLGVWEHKDERGRISRAMISPLDISRYTIQLTMPGKKPRQVLRYEFEAWPSRVGDSLFLTMLCTRSDGDVPVGAYVFAHPQLLNQNKLRIRILQLDVDPAETSYHLRQAVRQKLKDGTLYEPKLFTDWTRVEEVTWGADGSSEAFRPIRNPTL